MKQRINYSIKGVKTFVALFIEVEIPDGASDQEIEALAKEEIIRTSGMMEGHTAEDITIHLR